MPKGKKTHRALLHVQKQMDKAANFKLPSIWGTTESAHRNLNLTARAALDSFVRGNATQESWRSLAERLNVFQLILSRHFNSPECEAVLRRGEEALRSINQRFNRNHVFGWTGEERNDLIQTVELCEELQRNCLRRELLQAYEDVTRANGGSPNKAF